MTAATIPSACDLEPAVLAGQLVCVALRDYTGDAAERARFLADIDRYHWGAVIVFGGDAGAVSDLIAEADRRLAVPLLATADFERGFGQQFPADGTIFPPLMALGAAADPALATAVGRAIGGEMAGHGFHVNYAPVTDLANEPGNPIVGTRSAGEDPALASAIVRAFVEGLQSAGVAATVKHVPGHGRTTVDSHQTMPVVVASAEALEAADGAPIRAGIDAGARVVMTAHVAYPSLEPDRARDRPATLSPAICSGVVRERWRFDGVITSDALMMGALTGMAPGEVALTALDAGVDWLHYPEDPAAVHRALVDATRSGPRRERASRAADRVLALKRWCRVGSRRAAPAVSAAPLAEALAVAALTADPPVPPAGAAWPDRAQWVIVLDGSIESTDVVIPAELGPEASSAALVVDATQPTAGRAADEIRHRCRNAWVACAVFNSVRAWKNRSGLSPVARALVRAACEPAREAVLINFSNPAMVGDIGAPTRVLWAYGEDAASQRAALAFLRGKCPANGRLPISLGRNAGSETHVQEHT